MKVISNAQAGSFESSDILILVAPAAEGSGRKIEIESGVYMQYGDKIEELINEVLDLYNIADIHLKANDKGAIEPVILARMETALSRALNEQQGTLY